jgi:glucose-1-phosphate thymidylyltransferase
VTVQGVILGAGKGTRLYPLTLTRSKAMAPVAGKPLIGRVADLLVSQGVRELVVVVSATDHELRAYATAERLGVPVQQAVQEQRLGMAHALGLATPWLQGDFVLSACDNLAPPGHLGEMIALHRAQQAAATLSLMPIDIAHSAKTGVVVWEPPFVRRIVEKPQPADAPSNISSLPLYVLSPQILPLLAEVQPSPRGEYELQDALQLLMARTGRVLGVITPSREQVTNAADLLALNLAYLAQTPDLLQLAGTVAVDVRLTPPVVVEAGAEVAAGCDLGPGVYVEAGATLGAGARLAECLVLRGAVVEAGSRIIGQMVAREGQMAAPQPNSRAVI